MLDLGLTGKVAIVTGGSEGLGRATAMRFAAEGCHVVICARRKDVLEQAAETIRKRTGVQVLAQAADVTRPGAGGGRGPGPPPRPPPPRGRPTWRRWSPRPSPRTAASTSWSTTRAPRPGAPLGRAAPPPGGGRAASS